MLELQRIPKQKHRFFHKLSEKLRLVKEYFETKSKLHIFISHKLRTTIFRFFPFDADFTISVSRCGWAEEL